MSGEVSLMTIKCPSPPMFLHPLGDPSRRNSRAHPLLSAVLGSLYGYNEVNSPYKWPFEGYIELYVYMKLFEFLFELFKNVPVIPSPDSLQITCRFQVKGCLQRQFARLF